MEKDYSLAALQSFLKYVSEKGLANPSTATGWRVATSKVLSDLSAREQADVRTIDVETAFLRFGNKNAGQFTPASLAQYRARVSAALQEFISWRDDPEAYRPRTLRTARSESPEKPAKKAMSRPSAKTAGQPRSESKGKSLPQDLDAPAGSMTMAFPLRADFLAQLVLPRDLNTAEAKRLGAFLLTVAHDYKG